MALSYIRKRRVPCHKAAGCASEAGFLVWLRRLCERCARSYSALMDDRPKTGEQAAQRRRRLSAALRENLKRRKEQARGRSTPEAGAQAGKPHDSAGIVDDK
jgi:hypothetical protein